MITYNGNAVFPKNSPQHEPNTVPSIADIACGLGRMVRFAGQTQQYYTVLCHTLTVAQITTPEARIYALLHDAPESIVADVPATWKTNAAMVRENELMEAICHAHNLAWPPPRDLWEAVKKSDAAALAAEAHALGHSQAQEFWPIEKFTTLDHIALHQTMINKTSVMLYLDPREAHTVYQSAFDDAMRMVRQDAKITRTTSKTSGGTDDSNE